MTPYERLKKLEQEIDRITEQGLADQERARLKNIPYNVTVQAQKRVKQKRQLRAQIRALVNGGYQ